MQAVGATLPEFPKKGMATQQRSFAIMRPWLVDYADY